MSHYFAGSKNFAIQNSTFNTYHSGSKGGFERLQEYVAHGAFHDSGERFDPPKCHPNTRVAVIKWITEWIDGSNEETRKAPIMWLYGAAGAGKSAIAQTIAEILDGQHFFLASFFFWRNDSQRGIAKLLVTTLAYQLAVKLPRVFRDRVGLAFENDPLIITRSLEAQFKAFITEPLLELLQSGFSTNNHFVMIIDGLDECEDPKVQSRIVNLCFNLLRVQDIPLKILIACRPEFEISSSFDSKPSSMLVRIALNSDYQPDEDIRRFLVDTFYEIKTQHCLHVYIPDSWPSDNIVDTLVKRSSGQFIYASTVVKYVASPRHRPTHRLEVVLGIRPPKQGDSPFAELDALYRNILMGVEDVDLILRIIGFLILHPAVHDPDLNLILSVADMEDFFSLDPGDIQLLLQNLGSLISLTSHQDGAPEFYVNILHASLKDYLVDQSRSKDLFLDPPKKHTHYTELCIAHITTVGSGPWNVFQRYFYHCPRSESSAQLLAKVLNLTLSRCHTLHSGYYYDRSSWFVGEYFEYLESLRKSWDDPAVSQFEAVELIALEQLIKSQFDGLPHSHLFYLLACMSSEIKERIWEPASHDDPVEYIDLLSMQVFLASPRRIILLGGLLNSQILYFSVLGKPLRGSVQNMIQDLDTISDIYPSAALFALRYIITHFPYIPWRPSRSSRYRRTRTQSPAQSRWYRRSVNPSYNTYRTNGRFREFVFQTVTAGTQYMDDTPQYMPRVHVMTRHERERIGSFGWAMHVLPVFLERSGHSEELVACARHARIMRINDYSSPLGKDLGRKRRSAALNAIKAYLRRVEGDERS
ncbi:hypothetical protein CVT25_013194 [Psilocybe cyanescens]|uniref:Nephrocystin 3-like N-terminal domain-containing protein n=1 Tax=Psilocybe cyanescens TaxID=93625 RepID=A0A409XLH2_PSICY|nr:hypothetical protein CVT25_013194 [Psilocybe cyanescens]